MESWVVATPGPIDAGPLRRVSRDVPEPGPGRIRIRVSCCGVCRTDLHPHRDATTPGHEIVGDVEAAGPGALRFSAGDRVGVPWLARTDGTCAHCRRGRENLCVAPQFTGWDVDGGYADYCLANEAYVY